MRMWLACNAHRDMLGSFLNLKRRKDIDPEPSMDDAAPPAPKSVKVPKAPKEPKAPKAPKEPKEPKAPKAPKEPKEPKAPKAPKVPKAAKPAAAAPAREKAPTVLRTGVDVMSNTNYKRLALLAGVKRIRGKERLYHRCKQLTKSLVASIVKNSIVLMKASKKNTLTASMVLFEAQRQGHTIYWTDPQMQTGPQVAAPPVKKPSVPKAVVE